MSAARRRTRIVDSAGRRRKRRDGGVGSVERDRDRYGSCRSSTRRRCRRSRRRRDSLCSITRRWERVRLRAVRFPPPPPMRPMGSKMLPTRRRARASRNTRAESAKLASVGRRQIAHKRWNASSADLARAPDRSISPVRGPGAGLDELHGGVTLDEDRAPAYSICCAPGTLCSSSPTGSRSKSRPTSS